MANDSDVTAGVVIRGISTVGVFTKEELDQDGRLQEASVNAQQGVSRRILIAEGMNKARFKGGFASAKAEDIIKQGGKVMKAPIPGNRNHCQIFGLTLTDANNLFSNHQVWGDL